MYSEIIFVTLLIRRAINDVTVIPLNTLLISWPINDVTGVGAFRNGNGHISTPALRKSLLTIAFESSLRDLQLVSHWHCRKTSYFTKK